MFFYIHGDDSFSSRQKLVWLCQDFLSQNPGAKIVRLEKGTPRPQLLNLVSYTNSLFDEKRIFIIEKLKSFPPSVKRELLERLKKREESILIWEEEQTSSFSSLKKIWPQLKELKFPQPKTIFQLLDNIYPSNRTKMLDLLEQTLCKQPFELVFYFIKNHMRNLILSQRKNSPLPSWQKAKMFRQREKFDEQRLSDFYRRIIEMELNLKSGSTIVDPHLLLVNLLLRL